MGAVDAGKRRDGRTRDLRIVSGGEPFLGLVLRDWYCQPFGDVS